MTAKGYYRLRGSDHRLRMLHVLVWEEANGPVPPGMNVHHRNEDKRDFRLENLELVDPTTHKRIHGGCHLVDGVWMKPCKKCGMTKPESEFYAYPAHNGLYYKCRVCASREAVEHKKRRRRSGAEVPT